MKLFANFRFVLAAGARFVLAAGASALLSACALAAPQEPLAGGADIRFDARQISHELYGFGTQIWATELSDGVLNTLRALDIDYVRFSITSSTSDFGKPIPIDASPLDMDKFIQANFDTKSRLALAKKLFAATKEMNISTVLLIWAAPQPWQPAKNELLPEYIDDFARLWGAIVQYMSNQGMRPDYIELVNEPHGKWNTFIRPPLYNRLAKLVREDLDRRGLREVGILGPGVGAQTGHKWVDELDGEGRKALFGWSAHNYETDKKSATGVFAPFAEAAKGAVANKPIFLTEYSTRKLTYGDRHFPRKSGKASVPPDQQVTSSTFYAVQVFQNTLSLINAGANSLFYWQAGDYSWSGTSGLIDRYGKPKPVFTALRTLYPNIPDHAKVLKPLQTDAAMTAAAFSHDDRVVLALANNSPHPVTRRVVLSPPMKPVKIEAEAYENGQTVAKQVSMSADGSTFTVSLPAWSTENVRLQYAPGVVPK